MAIVDRERIVRQLGGYNPWWGGLLVRAPAFERLAVAMCFGRLVDVRTNRATMLSGPRRVGKSTVLRQVARRLLAKGVEPRAVLYLSLDDNILRMLPLRDILNIYHETFHPESETAYLLLDEVCYSRDWDIELKTLIDHHPGYRILATGSAAAEQHDRVADSGVGRWTTVPIPTLSFYEFLHIRGEAPDGIAPDLTVSGLRRVARSERISLGVKMRPTLPSFQRYLLVGGFPETALLEDIGDSQRLIRDDVVDRVLGRDMTAIFGVRRIPELERLFIYLCIHSGGQVNVSGTGGEIGLPRQTVETYLDYLVRSNLVFRVDPHDIGGKKSLKIKHKYYLVDAGIRNAVLLSGEEVLGDAAQMGLVVETAVLRHLFAFYYQDTPRVTYWLDSKSGKEVDIIVSSPRYTIPVEVKYREKQSESIPLGLARFLEMQDATYAVVVTQSESDFETIEGSGKTSDVLRIPAHIFTYLLGRTERR